MIDDITSQQLLIALQWLIAGPNAGYLAYKLVPGIVRWLQRAIVKPDPAIWLALPLRQRLLVALAWSPAGKRWIAIVLSAGIAVLASAALALVTGQSINIYLAPFVSFGVSQFLHGLDLPIGPTTVDRAGP